jgi:hypothetical protein
VKYRCSSDTTNSFALIAGASDESAVTNRRIQEGQVGCHAKSSADREKMAGICGLCLRCGRPSDMCDRSPATRFTATGKSFSAERHVILAPA